jgi:AcrR family transcriptional regulator
MSTSVQSGVSRRPGGRTADVTNRVHQAIIDLLVEGGVQTCTFSAVAERAGIERSTLYRRFPDRWEAIIDAVVNVAGTDIMPDLGDTFDHDLRSVLRKLRDTLDSPLGPAVLALAIELQSGRDNDYPRAYFDRRMEQLEPMFEAAVARGELAANVDREALFSCAAGPVYFRKFVAARPLDDAFIDHVVDNVSRLYCGKR